MRLLFVLALGVILGWIGGTLNPLPSAWLASMHIGSVAQSPTSAEDAEAAPAPTATPASESVPAATPPQTTRRGAVDEQTLAQYRAWIHEARQTHPYADSEERMYAVMLCESRGQASIVSPAGHTGLFQYSSATWSSAWNTYRDQSIRDPRAQIFATALAWQRNMQRQWGCYANPH